MDGPPEGAHRGSGRAGGFQRSHEGARGRHDGGDVATDDTVCPRCGESRDLAKVKGCVACLRCGYKFDCNGW